MSKTRSIVAISGDRKVKVLTNLSKKEAAYQRRELAGSNDNVDMLGNQVCKYRIKHC